MKRYYELKLQNSRSSSILKLRLSKLPKIPLSWIECDDEALEAGRFPRISIIDAVAMLPREIIGVANQCRSSCVALWGVPRAVAGLPVLPMRFSTRDLLAITKGEEESPAYCDMHRDHHSITKVFPLSTIPMVLCGPMADAK